MGNNPKADTELLISKRHTEHCAINQVWLGNECECGAGLPPTQPAPAPLPEDNPITEVRFCWNCGAAISGFDRECCECGDCGFGLAVYPYAKQWRRRAEAAEARVEKLEWLVEVTNASSNRIWLMKIFDRVEMLGTFEQRRALHLDAHQCLDDLRKAALAAVEG